MFMIYSPYLHLKNQTQIEIENKKIQKTINQVKLVWNVYQQK